MFISTHPEWKVESISHFVPSRSISESTETHEEPPLRRQRRQRRQREIDPILAVAGVRYAPKGVYTTGARFLVQRQFRSTGAKYSRNVETLVDALWLYEIKVLSDDKPRSVNLMLNAGNFMTLSDLQIVTSEAQYITELRSQIIRLHETLIIDTSEFNHAKEALHNMQ